MTDKDLKAIVLLSGGLDSTTALALALSRERNCIAITFDYRQRNHRELESAKAICDHFGVQQRVITLHPSTFSGSSLSGTGQVPKDRSIHQIYQKAIPSTYVPGRNTLFLAYAVGQAEIFDADEIYFSVNAADVGAYPDARPAFLQTFADLMKVATKQAVESKVPQLITPFIKMHKRDIIKQATALKAPLHLTLSCYDPSATGVHCGRCDACYLRKEGFMSAKQPDPTKYQEQGLPLEAAESSR